MKAFANAVAAALADSSPSALRLLAEAIESGLSPAKVVPGIDADPGRLKEGGAYQQQVVVLAGYRFIGPVRIRDLLDTGTSSSAFGSDRISWFHRVGSWGRAR
jgi:hypothetical protein